MTLSSRHRIRNSSPVGLRPSTLPLGHTILTFTRGWGRNIFVSFKPPRPGTEPRTLAWKAAVLTTTPGPPPIIILWYYVCDSMRPSRSIGQLKGQMPKYIFVQMSTNTMCNTSFWSDFEWRIHLWFYFGDSMTSSTLKMSLNHQNVEDKKEIPRSNCKRYHFNSKKSILRSSDQNMIFNK